MKCEFENLAIRNNKEISGLLYDTIERFYTSDNDYHRKNGGLYETKQEFVKRVFGGKVNTPKTILEKIIKESQKENRFFLEGCNVSKSELDNMDKMIEEQYTYLSKYDY